MNSKQLERLILSYTSLSYAKAHFTTHNLRKSGLVPPTKRGVAAYEINSNDASTILIGLAAPSTSQAACFVHDVKTLRGFHPYPFFKQLTGLISHPTTSAGIERVEISDDASCAVIRKTNTKIRFGRPHSFGGRITFYDGDLLRAIAENLQESSESIRISDHQKQTALEMLA